MKFYAVLFFAILISGCSADTFTQIPPEKTFAISFDSGSDLPDSRSEFDAQSQDVMGDDAMTKGDEAISFTCFDPNEVAWQGHCYYLDGSGGICDKGYTLSSNAVLGFILGETSDAWKGKNYKHQISDNACVMTSDSTESFGMVTHANVNGPFGSGEPIFKGSSCYGVYFQQSKQLTLCVSL